MYLSWDEKVLTDFSDANIASMYDRGYVFTRKAAGRMQQTRSLRVNLTKFKLSSENKRVLKRVEGIEITAEALPMANYHWGIGKLAKDFYAKFGQNTFSANKIKELLTDTGKGNFNALFSYSDLGYAICYAGEGFTHYSYPFYDIERSPKDMGLGMMTMAVMLSKEQGDKYIYLGSASRPSDTYKLQFDGLEWFDRGTPGHAGAGWKSDYAELKAILKNGQS